MRGTKILRAKLGSGEETRVVDSDGVADLDGSLLQQPELSHDGKYIAITLRGSKRETGIWDIAKKIWTQHRPRLPDQLDARRQRRSTGSTRPATAAARSSRMPIKDGKPHEGVRQTTSCSSWTCRGVARTNTFRSSRPTANGWCGASPSAGTITTSPTTRSICGRSARRGERACG